MKFSEIMGDVDGGASAVVEMDQYEKAPAELRARPQWVVWKRIERGGSPTKVPYRSDGGGPASASDPSTWSTFEEAVARVRDRPGRYAGVGYVFADDDPYVGVDLDGCLDGGEIAEWARPWLEKFAGCYVEVSPSGGGVKVWARGRLPGAGGGRRVGDEGHTAVEAYDRGRYFCLTGDVLSSPVGEIPDRQEAVDDLHAWIKKKVERAEPAAPRPRPFKPAVPAVAPPTDWTAEARASAYLATVDPAVAGERGHDRAFYAACRVGPGFDLDPEVAYRLLRDEFNPRCRPPWSERELRHKVEDAYRVETRRGFLLGDGKSPAAKGKGGGAVVEVVDEATGLAEAVDNDYRLARLVLSERFRHADGPTLRFWKNEWHAWRRGAWTPTPDVEVNAIISHVARAEFERHARIEGKPVRAVGTRLVGNVAAALRELVLLPEHEHPRQPAWLAGEGPDAAECMNFRNGILHLPTLADFGPQHALIPPTPRYWTSNALDYDFDPMAPEPVEFLKFLHSLWPDDPESRESLQQWMGYLLTPDTSRQKALMIVGRPRSGKGTIARLIASLVGEANTVSPTLTSLGTQFGLQALIGKSVAFCGETRLTARADGAAIVESLLSVSGEDEQSIERKHTTPWKGRLRVRFVFSANEVPRLADASKALMTRLIFLMLKQSFEGREDRELESKLRAERPGILLWAIRGWEKLRAAGRFIQPASAGRVVSDMEELSNPVGMFVEERCEVGADLKDEDGRPARVSIKRLYEAWCEWCRENGRERTGDTAWFGTRLKASHPCVERYQERVGGIREWRYRSIRLQAGF